MRRAALATALLAALVGSPAAANPLDMFGFGSRCIGLGSACTALADDFSRKEIQPHAVPPPVFHAACSLSVSFRTWS